LDKEFRTAAESERKMLKYELDKIGRRLKGLQQIVESKIKALAK
jgi:hypothetical protein